MSWTRFTDAADDCTNKTWIKQRDPNVWHEAVGKNGHDRLNIGISECKPCKKTFEKMCEIMFGK